MPFGSRFGVPPVFSVRCESVAGMIPWGRLALRLFAHCWTGSRGIHFRGLPKAAPFLRYWVLGVLGAVLGTLYYIFFSTQPRFWRVSGAIKRPFWRDFPTHCSNQKTVFDIKACNYRIYNQPPSANSSGYSRLKMFVFFSISPVERTSKKENQRSKSARQLLNFQGPFRIPLVQPFWQKFSFPKKTGNFSCQRSIGRA